MPATLPPKKTTCRLHEGIQNRQELFPENAEMKFWTAVTMVNNGMIEQSLPLFKTVFALDSNWRFLCRDCEKSGN
jgi:hypothetical protein